MDFTVLSVNPQPFMEYHEALHVLGSAVVTDPLMPTILWSL